MNFLLKIFSPVCLSVSLLFLLYVFYKSEYYSDGSLSGNYYILYFIASFLLIIFSIITFFINQKIKEYLIISVVSLIASAYMLEVYLTFKEQLAKKEYAEEQLTKEQLYKKETRKKYDSRTKLEIYRDLKKINSKIKVNVTPFAYLNENYSIFPLSSISNSETIYCNENGYYQIWHSDRYGFNNPDTEWNSKEIEYLLVGDSFTHGACVNRPNDIGSVLRTLSKKSVLNLGYSGNGPLIEYATLREYLTPAVKKVIWVFCEGNDLNNLSNEIKNKILKTYMVDLSFTQNLKLKQNDIDNIANSMIEKEQKKEGEGEKYTFSLIRFIKFYKLRTAILPPPEPELELKKILKLAKDLTIKNNSKLYFVSLPVYNRYKKNSHYSGYFSAKKIADELRIPFIDIHKEVFEKEPNPLNLFPFKIHGHYNTEGYNKIAKAIYKYTKD